MRAILPILLLASLSASAEAPNCPAKLPELAAKLELDFLKKEECVADECADLFTIEDKIRRLENEVAILRGFEKLIDEIQAQKDKLAEVNPRDAAEVARELSDSLRTASLMESLVSEENPDGFVAKLSQTLLSKSPEEIERPTVFKTTLLEACNTYSQDQRPDFCGQIETLSDQDAAELGQLLKQSPGPEQLSDWRDALSITTPDGSPYSFSAMHSQLRDAGLDLTASTIQLTPEQLSLLRNLPDIQNSAGLAYLDKIKKAKDQLEMTKIFGEMKHLTTELQNRQRFETQSSLSILWNELKTSELQLSKDERTACDEAFKALNQTADCLKALQGKVSSLSPSAPGKKRLLALLQNIDTSKPHLEALSSFETDCLKLEVLNEAQKSGKLPQTCLEKFPAEGLQAKLDEIQRLNDQKRAAIEKNRDLFDLRNIAMDQIRNCQGIDSKVGEFCSTELGIDAEVKFLALEETKLSLHVRNVDTLRAIDEICLDDVKQDSGVKAEACRILKPDYVAEKDEPAPKPEPPKSSEDDFDYTPRNTQVRDAWVQGGMNLAATIGQGLMQRPYNPYAYQDYQRPYYYTPGYNYGMGSISDNLLMFNSAYFGSMSYYQSAPGYVPYTAYPIQGSYAHSLSQYFSPYTPLR